MLPALHRSKRAVSKPDPATWQGFIDAIERMRFDRQASRFAELAVQMSRAGDREGATAQALRPRLAPEFPSRSNGGAKF